MNFTIAFSHREGAAQLLCNRPQSAFSKSRHVGFPRVMHSPTAVPNLYAGMIAGGEQFICTGLRQSVGVAIDQFGCCDMVCGI